MFRLRISSAIVDGRGEYIVQRCEQDKFGIDVWFDVDSFATPEEAKVFAVYYRDELESADSFQAIDV